MYVHTYCRKFDIFVDLGSLLNYEGTELAINTSKENCCYFLGT
jgi:hypothetical protein